MYNNQLPTLEAGTFKGLTSLQELYVQSDVFVAMKSPHCGYSISLRGLMRMLVGIMMQFFV